MRSCQNCFESSLRHGCVVVNIASLADFPCRVISAATLSMIGPADRREIPVLARGGRGGRGAGLFFFLLLGGAPQTFLPFFCPRAGGKHPPLRAFCPIRPR